MQHIGPSIINNHIIDTPPNHTRDSFVLKTLGKLTESGFSQNWPISAFPKLCLSANWWKLVILPTESAASTNQTKPNSIQAKHHQNQTKLMDIFFAIHYSSKPVVVVTSVVTSMNEVLVIQSRQKSPKCVSEPRSG